jgi:hypothetical protein
MLVAFFYVCKIVEIHHQKKEVTSLIFILMFSKYLDKVYSDFKDWTSKKFQINLMLELCLK